MQLAQQPHGRQQLQAAQAIQHILSNIRICSWLIAWLAVRDVIRPPSHAHSCTMCQPESATGIMELQPVNQAAQGHTPDQVAAGLTEVLQKLVTPR